MGFRKNHIAAACEFCVLFHIQRFRAKRCTRFRGQALCIQRRHIKFAFGRFDGCAADFCLQRVDLHIRLRGDRRVASLSRERARFHAARCRFCGKCSRGHVIQRRFVLAR